MPVETWDAIVIGTGQGGKPLAQAFAEAGRKTAIIERDRVGGTCVIRGCTPTKTMVGSARAVAFARRGGDYGFGVDGLTVDMAAVRDRKRRVVDGGEQSNTRWMESVDGLELIRGDAHFTGERTVEVALNDGGRRTLRAKTVVINTGLAPRIPAIPGLDGVPYLDSTSIMELGEVPDQLIVVGGGYVGLEFGQMFHRFGADVTVIQKGPQLLPREDDDVATTLTDILEDEGLAVRLNSEPISVETDGSGGVRVTVRTGDGESTITGSHLLIATGRVPTTDALRLDRAGIETDARGFITTDSRFRTSAAGVYAMGDVTGGPAFTHISYDDYRLLKANLLDGADRSTDGRLVPYTVFTDPQLGRVGLSEREARDQGRDVNVVTLPMSRVAMAIERAEDKGMLKAVVQSSSRRILGFVALGYEGGELMSLVQVAMQAGMTADDLREMTFSHPSFAEALNNLFAKLG